MTPHFAFGSLAVLLAGLVAIGALIFVFTRKTSRTTKIVAIALPLLLAVVAVLFLGVLHLAAPKAFTYDSGATHVVLSEAPQPIRIATDFSNPPAWQESADVPLEADVYPSKPAAARALARQMATLLNGKVDADGNAIQDVTLKITGDDDSTVASPFAGALRQASLNVDMGPAEAGPTTSPDKKPSVIELSIRVTGSTNITYVTNHSSSTSITSIPRGTMQAKLAGPAGGAVRSVEWVTKPWVDSLSEFRSVDPFHRNATWFVARSRQMCNSESEALDDAYAQAVDYLYQQVTASLPQLSAAGRVAAGTQLSEAQLRNLLAAEVRTGPLMADQFSQRFDRSYGTVWRAAVLVDASSQNIQRLANQTASTVQIRTSSWARTAASIVGLTILVCLVYLFLNLATRGYYAWTLRKTVIAIVLAGALLLLFCG